MPDPVERVEAEALPAMAPGSPIEVEWNFYCREVLRLLAEGHEGRWVLIKGEEIIGIFVDRTAAVEAGYARFGVVPLLVQQVVRQHRIIRAGDWWGCQR